MNIVDIPQKISTDWAAIAKHVRELPNGKALEMQSREGQGVERLRANTVSCLLRHEVRIHTRTANGLLYIWENRQGKQ